MYLYWSRELVACDPVRPAHYAHQFCSAGASHGARRCGAEWWQDTAEGAGVQTSRPSKLDELAFRWRFASTCDRGAVEGTFLAIWGGERGCVPEEQVENWATVCHVECSCYVQYETPHRVPHMQ
eukprot:2036480-Pleurochrysis_carterae.AAC.1